MWLCKLQCDVLLGQKITIWAKGDERMKQKAKFGEFSHDYLLTIHNEHVILIKCQKKHHHPELKMECPLL